MFISCSLCKMDLSSSDSEMSRRISCANSQEHNAEGRDALMLLRRLNVTRTLHLLFFVL